MYPPETTTKSASLAPFAFTYHIIRSAFHAPEKTNRALQRAVKRALRLANLRGFEQTKDFMKHFMQQNPSEKMSERPIRRLFAYISLSEFIQFTQPAYQPIMARNTTSRHD